MKAFVATRVSGEDRAELLTLLSNIKEALQVAHIEAYITELEPSHPEDGKKILRAFERIAESDLLIVIYKPGPASEGMSAEIGYAYGRKPIWIFARDGSESSLFAVADKFETWQSVKELLKQIKEAT
ncbi:hypothetical protein KBD11_02800 [Candidatus Saccharibacteria bacterium]|nr:hypothetical protein [Candidatus Saccharibacteria bacterium]